MATGRSTQLTRQIGEHFVASELGRNDVIATLFVGNVSHFDLLASTQDGRSFPVQVKLKRNAMAGGFLRFLLARLSRQIASIQVLPP